jgi:predicted transposase/invertase (TIGR01784 family)
MTKKPGNLHDSMSRLWFSEPEAARLLFSEQLPERLSALFKPGLPKLLPGSFIDDKLVERRTDLLYQAPLKEGGDAYVYVLIEHKSSSDPLTLLQMLGYKHAIWSRPPGSKAKVPLKPIIPLVVYHGARRWTAPADFHGMFARLNDDIRPLIDQFSYVLIDLGRIDDDRLSRDLRQRAYLAALKYNTRPDMRKHGLPRVVRLLADLPNVDVQRILRYIVSQHQGVSRSDLDSALLRYAPQRKDEIMNVFIQEIEEQGKAKWMAEGKAEGRAEGKAEFFLKLLARRFGALSNDIEQRARSADAETLDRWGLKILDAKSIQDVFSD